MAYLVRKGVQEMKYPFPSAEWVDRLVSVLNHDERYAEVAHNWEGDLTVFIEADDETAWPDLPMAIYVDLWHGKCRRAEIIDLSAAEIPPAKYILRAPRSRFLEIFSGDLDPIQAMLTRRLKVEGNMAYMLRNIPTVLDFVRCCRIVEAESGGDSE